MTGTSEARSDSQLCYNCFNSF